MAVLLAAGAAAANDLVNPDFTNWDSTTQPTGWIVENRTYVTVEQASDPVHSAPYSVKLTRLMDSTGNNNGVRQYVPVSRNQEYTFRAWCHDNSADARGGISITWTRADSTSLGSSGYPAYSDSTIHDWQRLTVDVTSPDSTSLVYAKVLIRCYGFVGNQPGGYVFFDDAEFAAGPPAVADRDEGARPAPAITISPNPLSGNTTVAFSVAQAGPARLEVYDLTGARVAVPFSGELGAGRHVLTYDGTSASGGLLPGGLYFVVLTPADGPQSVRKLVVER